MFAEQRATTDNHQPAWDGGTAAVEVAPAGDLAADCAEPTPTSETSHSESNAENLPPPSSAVAASGINSSDCGCGGKSTPPALVYALGQLGYDFGTETNRDSLIQMSGNQNLNDPATLLNYLQQDPASAPSIIWTLCLDTTVIYAVVPYGPYAASGYERLREYYREQLEGRIDRVSVPGRTQGSLRLLNGQIVPVLYAEVRGMYSWLTAHLVEAVLGKAPKTDDPQAVRDDYEAQRVGISNFLDRVYYEIRNLGLTPQERATNYAATNAFQLRSVYADSLKGGLRLDKIDVERSPICRPGTDCWDVKLTFFNPARRLDVARRVYRFTVDVSGPIPVTVGSVRNWDIY